MSELIRLDRGDRLLPRLSRTSRNAGVASQARWTSGLEGYAGPLSRLWGGRTPIAVGVHGRGDGHARGALWRERAAQRR